MHIYMYTTDTYEKNGMFKIGQTTRSPSERVKEQDTTSNPEELRIVYSWLVPSYVTDHMVHAHLESQGFQRTRANREWFRGNKDELSEVIHEYLKTTYKPSARSKPAQQAELPKEDSPNKPIDLLGDEPVRPTAISKHIPQRYAEQEYAEQRRTNTSTEEAGWFFLFFIALFLNLIV